MSSSVEKVVSSLKGIIELNGFAYLKSEPYDVYKNLVKNGIDNKTASALWLMISRIWSRANSYLMSCLNGSKRNAVLIKRWQITLLVFSRCFFQTTTKADGKEITVRDL